MAGAGDVAFAYFRDHYRESIERMFAAVSDLYAEYWHEFFHFAIFENEDESWESAFHHTHDRYLRALNIAHARNVLELGCGRGGFTHILAQHTKGNVLGIDLSRAQLSHARRFKRSNLRFQHHDIMNVDALGQTFDAVACIDAACYLPDKRRAIDRISRVMAPGARFLLVDWCVQAGLSRAQEELVLYPFMKYWAIPRLETASSYKKLFRRSGFRVLEVTEWNDKVKKNWEFGYGRALTALKELSVRDVPRLLWKGLRLGPDAVRLIKDQFPAAVHIKVGFDIGFLRYVSFVAEKD